METVTMHLFENLLCHNAKKGSPDKGSSRVSGSGGANII